MTSVNDKEIEFKNKEIDNNNIEIGNNNVDEMTDIEISIKEYNNKRVIAQK